MDTTRLSSLSDEEFKALRDAVDAENKKRGAFYKGDTQTYSKLKDILHDEYISAGADENGAFSATRLLETSIFRLADAATGNYKVRRCKQVNESYTPRSTGAVVFVDRDQYQKVCDAIIDILRKEKTDA